MTNESSGRKRKIVKSLSIVGILLLLSLMGIGYFIDFNGDRIYTEETPIPDADSGLMVLVPDGRSTGMMPDVEEEDPDADGDVVAESAHSSGGRRGSGGGFFHASNSEPTPPDLMIKDPDEDWQDGVTATWTMSNMMPGDSVSSWVKFINNGETPANILTVNCTSVTTDPPGPESDTQENTNDLDKQMIITEMTYYYVYYGDKQINCLSLLNDNNEDGNIDLDDLEAQTIELPAPGMTYASATTLTMTIQFNPGAGNDYQGDILDSTFRFTLIE